MSKIEVDKIDPQSGTNLELGTSGDTITIPAGATITNNGTANGFGSADTEKVKVSANDTTAGFLNGKLVAGTNITLTEGSDGGDETLTVAASTTPAANSITTAQLAYNPNPFRNIVINGTMDIAQRATSVTGITGAGYNTVDRFKFNPTGQGTWTQSQSTDVPTGQGFATSLKLDCTTADASPASGDVLRLEQRFEGQNLQYLKKGTSSAVSTTLSFWIKSNKTGTFINQLQDIDNTRTISQAYTINSANTWEKKTLTFPGDTSGAFDNDNGNSLMLHFWFGAGSNYTSGTLNTSWNTNDNANRAVGVSNLADSTSNELYLTGVQWEAGTTASDFEFLPFDVNLARCQRYFFLMCRGDQLDVGAGGYYNSGQIFCEVPLPVTMRTTPSLVATSGTNYYRMFGNNTNDPFDALLLGGGQSTLMQVYQTTGISGTTGVAGWLRTNNSSASVAAEAEL